MAAPGLPTSNDLYGEKAYWDERYTNESADDASFDWLKSYKDVAPLLRALIPAKDARILMLGCGRRCRRTNIVNTDYSSVVIEQMRRRHEGARPGMQWLEMDVRDLEFEDGSFDVAIDKSTMDAMMSAKGDVWDPPQQVVDDCTAEVDEAIRTLKKTTGIFICLTFGQPHFRRRFLTRPDTTLEVKELGEAFHYYLYVLRT
ncbi:hypothetical protein C8R46DRAFT_1159576 [Mycena filopes]|nr:hypothetical protein C8R46DRAFT_1159576 [Mycena filopes]